MVRVSDKANDRCENANKKTISADHLEAALTVIIFLFRNSDLQIISMISKTWKMPLKNKISSKEKPVKGWKSYLPKTWKSRGLVGDSNSYRPRSMWLKERDSKSWRRLMRKGNKRTMRTLWIYRPIMGRWKTIDFDTIQLILPIIWIKLTYCLSFLQENASWNWKNFR